MTAKTPGTHTTPHPPHTTPHTPHTSVSTHILDTALGRPAAGVAVELSVRPAGDAPWAAHAGSSTDADGRCKDLPALPEGTAHVRLRFEVEPYLARAGHPAAEGQRKFGILLARHFVTGQDAIHTARIRIEEYGWERIETAGAARHSFVRTGQETRTAQVTFDGEGWEVISGLTGLTVLNSTDSEFWGFVKDKYTTLPEVRDRILATDVQARWRYGWCADDDDGGAPEPDWELGYAGARADLLAAFAETYSLSLQQTLYQMGARVIENRPAIDEIRLSLPNKH
ncbi:factor-independent urate hydroxylase, partial [Streptomyces sp. MCAF7]